MQGDHYAWRLPKGRVESDDRPAVDAEPDEYCLFAAVYEWSGSFECGEHAQSLYNAITRRLVEAGELEVDLLDEEELHGAPNLFWGDWNDLVGRTLEQVLSFVEPAELEVLGPKRCNQYCGRDAEFTVRSDTMGYLGAMCASCSHEVCLSSTDRRTRAPLV